MPNRAFCSAADQIAAHLGRRWVVVLGTASIVIGLAGCGEYPGIVRQSAGPVAVGQLTLNQSGNSTGSAEVKAAPTPTIQSETGSNIGPIELVQRDFEFVPNEVTTTVGEIVFVIRNGGRFTHDFRVVGNGVDERSKKNGAGRTMEFRITLDTPGDYEFSCPISNHADRGMTGILHVVAQ